MSLAVPDALDDFDDLDQDDQDEWDDIVATVATLAHPEPWRARAACIGQPFERFFPTRGEHTDAADAVCSECPVATECLEYALANILREGVWGGRSEKWRRKERHRRRCTDDTCTNRAHNAPSAKPAPEWVAPAYEGLWKRPRASRRKTFVGVTGQR